MLQFDPTPRFPVENGGNNHGDFVDPDDDEDCRAGLIDVDPLDDDDE